MSTHVRLDEENPHLQAHSHLHDVHEENTNDVSTNNTTTNTTNDTATVTTSDTTNTTTEKNETSGSNSNSSSNSSGNSSGNSWKLSVRTLTGQNILVDLEKPESAIVLDIKNKLESQLNLPTNFMRLIFAGRELVDGNKVTSYGIKDGDAIHLVLRQNQPVVRPTPNDNPNAAREGDYHALVMPGGDNNNNNNNNNNNSSARVVEAWQLGRAVKMFSIVDGIFLLLWAFSTWQFLFAVFLAICGFYGATHYKLSYVCLYVVYLLLSIGIRIYWMTLSEGFFFTLILVLGVLIEFYILNITLKFIKVIRRLTPADRLDLAQLRAPAFGF